MLSVCLGVVSCPNGLFALLMFYLCCVTSGGVGGCARYFIC